MILLCFVEAPQLWQRCGFINCVTILDPNQSLVSETNTPSTSNTTTSPRGAIIDCISSKEAFDNYLDLLAAFFDSNQMSIGELVSALLVLIGSEEFIMLLKDLKWRREAICLSATTI